MPLFPDPPSVRRPRVAIVGANFAGLRAAQRLGSGFDVTVFDPSAWFEWLPNIHELVSGIKKPADLRLPRRRLVTDAGHRFVRSAVTAIDPKHRRLTTSAGTEHEFDYCIMAVGGVSETYGVRGADSHALAFKNVEEAEDVRRRLEAIARSPSPRSVVIIGAGFIGIEILGEILRRYRGAPMLRLHVVEAGTRLMPGVSPRIDAILRMYCAQWKVYVHTGSAVAAITRSTVQLANGRRLHSNLTIWSGGAAAPPLLNAAGLASRQKQWAPVDPMLRSRRYSRIFIVGDAAGPSRSVAKQASHALEMGDCVADNLKRVVAGRPLRAFRPSSTPLLVAFGDLDTFLVAGRKVVANPAFATGKEAVYQLTMAQIDPPSGVDALSRLASRVAAGVTRSLARSR